MNKKRFEFIIKEERINNPKRYKMYASHKNKELYTVVSLRDINSLMIEIKKFILNDEAKGVSADLDEYEIVTKEMLSK